MDTSTSKHVVYKEHTFGYILSMSEKGSGTMVVMAVDYMAGGDPLLIDRTISVRKQDLRPAEEKDYEHFRVRM